MGDTSCLKEVCKRYEEKGPREKGLGVICRDIKASVFHVDTHTHTHTEKDTKSNYLEDARIKKSFALLCLVATRDVAHTVFATCLNAYLYVYFCTSVCACGSV